MENLKITLHGNIFGQDGYSSHTKNLFNALAKQEGVDMKLNTRLVQDWERKANDAEFKAISNKEIKEDWNIIITVPHMWKQFIGFGKNACYCVWEGDTCPASWIDEFLNPDVDLILVPSKHTAKAIWNMYWEGSEYQNDYMNKIALEHKPDRCFWEKVKVIPHGVDKNIFYSQRKKVENDGSNVTQLKTRNNAEVEDKTEQRSVVVDNHADNQFTFICNKGWRGTSWDRGGVQYLIKAFAEEFKKDENVKLIIKLNPAYINPQIIGQSIDALNLPEDRPPININCDFLPKEKLNELYNQCDCYVCATRAESFDLGTAEAMACGLPCLTSGYGGQIEHMIENKNALFFDYDLQEVKEDLMYESISWCIPKMADIRKKMRWMFEHQKEIKQMGINAEEYINNNFTWEHSASKIINLLK